MLKNFHIPLPPDLHSELKKAAKQQQTSATKIVRALINAWLEQRKKLKVRQKISTEITAFAREYAGTDYDLDPEWGSIGEEILSMTE